MEFWGHPSPHNVENHRNHPKTTAARRCILPIWVRWKKVSADACHGNGCADELLDAVPAYELLAAQPAGRQRRWSAYVHRTPDEAELAAIRRSSEIGLPYGERSWADRLCRRLNIDLTMRPRGRPQKIAQVQAQK